MSKEPKPPSKEPAIRVVMMPRDTNSQGAIFGGVILSYIDQAAFVEAQRQAHHRYVTVAMDAIEFHKPVFVGDIVSFYGETKRIGNTSMCVAITVYADRHSEPGKTVKVTQGRATFVAVDDNLQPVQITLND